MEWPAFNAESSGGDGEDDDYASVDWRLHLMQQLLEQSEGSRQLAARQTAAEEAVRRACLRWMYPAELSTLRRLHSNRCRAALLPRISYDRFRMDKLNCNVHVVESLFPTMAGYEFLPHSAAHTNTRCAARCAAWR